MKRTQFSEGEPCLNDSNSTGLSSRQARSTRTAGIVHKIVLENFLCHDKLEITFNEQINFIIGKNGSGKSAVLTGIVVALGERASTTSRGQSIKDFVKTGKPKAVVRVTLSNKGQGTYKKEIYGDYITIERTINATSGAGGYKILNEHGRVVSTKRSDLNRILAKMNLQVDNPVCILNQETAKNFLHSNDAHQKYKLFERATQIDVMHNEFSIAEDELSRSKSCMKEKLQSLEMLKTELKKWHTKKEWYEAINEVHDRKAKLENELAWAEVEEYEKVSSDVLKKKEDQVTQIERTRRRLQEEEERLTKLKEKHRTRSEDVVQKAQEINNVQAKFFEIEKQKVELNERQREFISEIRQLEIDKKRLINDKEDLIKEVEKLKKAHGDSEFAQRKDKRLKEIQTLKGRQEILQSTCKVTEHQAEQLKGALQQLRTEMQFARNESSRIQRILDPKDRTLKELQKADSNAHAVFGDWVPSLLQKIENTAFRGAKPKGPLGAYIKVKDKSWASVVETYLGGKLTNFVCSNDEDAKLLNRIMDDVVPRGSKPHIITSFMNGKLHDVSNYKVWCDQELHNRDIHCLMDMLLIDDPDVANILIDLCNIEQVLLIGEDRDAQCLLADSRTVPNNCKSAITKEGNTYYPDPNYRSYFGRVKKSAQFLQASLEEAINNLREETETLRKDVEKHRQSIVNLTTQLQRNECELKTEESKLSTTRKELTFVSEKIHTLESEHEPEPTDVIALEEDLLDIERKLENVECEHQSKVASFEEHKLEVLKVKQTHIHHQKVISSLKSGAEPLQDAVRAVEVKQGEIKENIIKLVSSITSMQSKLKGFEEDYEAAKLKADSAAADAAQLCDRVPVTKSVKNLNSELRQIKEQVAAQEKEYGSREYVLNEYRRRKVDYERANSEVANSQRSLKKMNLMGKQRKAFISRFRSSIEMRTHYVFQSLLKTRNFEGEIRFDSTEKTLMLLVTPPGREESPQPTPKRSRGNVTTDIRSLSGGERSFATVCFILSLWDAIESPFRILDEFDVFMDHVNRSISMDLLINEARENCGRQFIFLTPLGLEKQQLRSMNDLSIFKMTDPERRDGNE